jgi:myo-inositol-1(or 4)-monophosphatase
MAREAGKLLMQHLGAAKVSYKGDIELVTEADLASEKLIVEKIRSYHPQHGILAEESGEAILIGGKRSEWKWIIDPLDGTTNYAHGLPIYCSSLALEIDGRAEVGAIYDPNRRELFTAERGLGARLNGTPMTVSQAAAIGDALLVTGFPYTVQKEAGDLVALFGEFLARSRAVRRLGSAALDLCYVAAGRFDAFWEQQLKPWDVSAGALIVAEAGGRVTGMDGTPFDPAAGHLIASNTRLHQQVQDVIAAFRARKGTD